MLLERVAVVTGNKIDSEELLEKAEIRFLELVGYEAGHSDERIAHLMSALAQNGQADTTKSMAQVARAYTLHETGGPIFKCLEAYLLACAKNRSQSSSVAADPALIELIFWLEMAESPLVGQVVRNCLSKKTIPDSRHCSSNEDTEHHLSYLLLRYAPD